MKLDTSQREFLITFFERAECAGWKNIAEKLIDNGVCIIAGITKPWLGGIGNFIDMDSDIGDLVGCSRLTFNLDEFLGSEYFKEKSNSYLSKLWSHKHKLDADIESIQNL